MNGLKPNSGVNVSRYLVGTLSLPYSLCVLFVRRVQITWGHSLLQGLHVVYNKGRANCFLKLCLPLPRYSCKSQRRIAIPALGGDSLYHSNGNAYTFWGPELFDVSWWYTSLEGKFGMKCSVPWFHPKTCESLRVCVARKFVQYVHFFSGGAVAKSRND